MLLTVDEELIAGAVVRGSVGLAAGTGSTYVLAICNSTEHPSIMWLSVSGTIKGLPLGFWWGPLS